MKKTGMYKLKDFVFLGIITAIYFVLYAIIGVVTASIPIVHAFSPALFALIGGTIMLFLVIKVPKFGILTISAFLMQILFFVVGAGYLPWMIASVVGAFIGDCIIYWGDYKLVSVSIAYAFVQLGSVCGGLIPAMFFTEQYRQTWIERGVPAEKMDETIASSVGYIGLIVLIITAICAILGIFIGSRILAKHFKKNED